MTSIDLSRFVSSDGNVFAVQGLPEEVIAVLFAKYSRAKGGLREILTEMLKGEELGVEGGGGAGLKLTMANEKARAFHEKYVLGYGHASCAEHAVIHMGLEGVSILAAKALEDTRIGASFTEKSTRFVSFDTASFVTPPEILGASAHVQRLYQETCAYLVQTCTDLTNCVERRIRERHPKPPEMKAHEYNTMVHAKALDLCRGILPASTKTNLGMTINARAMELLLTKLYSHPAHEMQDLAHPIHKEALTVAPTLVKYAGRSPWRQAQRDPITMPRNLRNIDGDDYRKRVAERRKLVTIHADLVGTAALERVARGILWDASGPSIATSVRLTHDELNAAIEQAFANRSRHDRAPRAFESVQLQIDMILDYGCFRDLQRHRMVSWHGHALTPTLGLQIPEGLAELDANSVYREALRKAARAWEDVVEEVGVWAAQYVVPIGFNYHVLANTSLRELFHLVELRSGKGGHTTYRRIAQELHRQVEWEWPWAAKYMRCDHGEYEFARE